MQGTYSTFIRFTHPHLHRTARTVGTEKYPPLYCQNPNSHRHPLCIHACIISLYTHALVILSCYHTFSNFAPVCVNVLYIYIYIFHMLYTHIYLYFSIYSLTFYMTVAITMSTVVYITAFCIVLYDSYLA